MTHSSAFAVSRNNSALTLAVVGLALLTSACDFANAAPQKSEAVVPSAPAAAAAPQLTGVALGKKLVSTSACHDCHTPFKLGPKGPEPDISRALSGHPEGLVMPPAPKLEAPWGMSAAVTNTAWAGPWGVSFTANLTPDPETGLGKWKKEHFIQTIRTGRHMGRGRPVLPPMPVPVYQNFSDEELGAIFDYLQTIPAIHNRVPDPVAPPT